jgi:hypothetical protein
MNRIARVTGAVALALALAVPATGASVGTKTNNACKLLKRGEIEDALGQSTGKAKKGLTTQVSTACEWEIEPAGDLPDGVIATFIQRVGAKIAFDTNSEAPNAEEVPELGNNAFYDTEFDSVYVLKGDRLMFVQGVFINVGGGFQQLERRDELVALAKIARKRV